MHLLIRLLPTRADAEEILQETFLNAWKNLERVEHPERFKGWLMKIARNNALDFLRRSMCRAKLSANELIDTLIDPAARPPECSPSPLLDRFLAKLTPREYEVCVLLCLEGLSVAEVAEILKMNRNAVYVAIGRIREKFAKFLKENGDDF